MARLRFLNQICLTIAVLFSVSLLGLAKVDQEPSHRKTSEESELSNAQIRNHKAQAAFYDEQTKKLQKDPPRKTFWQNVKENPASVLGVLGATLAAFVALLSFLFNYRATLQNQRDTQFYEALKRFGDKDSPTMRATAAATLGEMAAREVYRFDLRHIESAFTLNDRPCMTTVRCQLLTGLLMEENYVVIQVIINETSKLIGLEPSSRLEMIGDANTHLENELLKDIAAFLVFSVAKDPVNTTDELWEVVSESTRFSLAALGSTLKEHRRGFLDFVESSRATQINLSVEERQDKLLKTQDQVRLNAFRLRILIYLCSDVLKKYGACKAIPFDQKLFLGNINLVGVNLADVQLEGSILSSAKLDDANFSNANLRGVRLNDCSLANTSFWKTQIDEQTDFTDANWWKANYFSKDEKNFDENILTTLFTRYSKPKADPSEYHPSVNRFLEHNEKLNETNTRSPSNQDSALPGVL